MRASLAGWLATIDQRRAPLASLGRDTKWRLAEKSGRPHGARRDSDYNYAAFAVIIANQSHRRDELFVYGVHWPAAALDNYSVREGERPSHYLYTPLACTPLSFRTLVKFCVSLRCSVSCRGSTCVF